MDDKNKKYDKIAYNKTYNARNYHSLQVRFRDSEYAEITEYCEINGISKNKLFVDSVMYCINHNIKFK